MGRTMEHETAAGAEPGLLSGYRVLDLCGEPGLLAGKLLADLGASVIKVEPPAGDSARAMGPLAPGVAEAEASLFWQAMNTGKQSVTLELASPRGKEIFLELAAKCDAVLESFAPGQLDKLGLGYQDLCQVRPDMILVSVTPFGSEGPYSGYAACDLVVWALSGLLYICGDSDRPPVRISLPQTWLHAATDAATGLAMALYHRGCTGQGQHVSVSALKAMERVAYTAHTLWDARGKLLRRQGSALRIPPLGTTTPVIWPCADGFVAFYLFGGAMGAVSNPALTCWMEEEGLATQAMLAMDWPCFDIGRMPQEQIDRDIVGPVGQFFRRHTQRELWDEGVKRRVMVYPVNDAAGVLAQAQLAERGFWIRLAHPAYDRELTLPGAFVKTGEGLCAVRGPAPMLGQHNAAVFEGMLGLDHRAMEALRSGGGDLIVAASNQAGILSGVRIIEFGWAVVGPLTTSWAGGYGADVIKVETRTRPDIIRSMTPFKNDRVHRDNSLFFGRENASKRSIALNLKLPSGREVAKRLVAACDVVLESYTAGVMDKFGLGYQDLIKIKPDLIMLSSCMYGQTGALRSMPGYGVPLTAISGLTNLCGWPDRAPCGPYGSYTDYLVPRFNLLAIASALDYRRRTGRGVYLDAAQLESSVQFVAPALLDQALTGRVAGRGGNQDPQAAPHGVYPTAGADRWIALAVFSEQQWRDLVAVMGAPEWTRESRWESLQGRLEHRKELDQRLAEWTAEWDGGELMEKLQARGVPAGAVRDGRELGSCPQLLFDNYYTRCGHPVMGEVDYAGHSITFSVGPQRVYRSPCLGEHTREICRELLDMNQEEFDRLSQAGAFD
jgi:crotonobetainyl-CoA:carnitine CoA-transferase CaiB-like acyl-CoA transferase